MGKNGFQESASSLPGHATLRTSAAVPPRPGFSGKWRVSIVLLASLLISFSGWYLARGITIRKAHDRFDFRVKTIETDIRERLQAYEFLLRGAGGLFAAADDVTRQSWKTYVTMMQVDQYYPGIQGIGFAKRILPSEKETHIRRIRSEGFPEYDIRPEGERPEYTSIIFLEPFDWRNQRAFGYDMFSETVRKDAMSRARDTGSAALSGKVTLVQETDKDVQAGFLMYLPIYQGGKLPESPEQRRELLLGYVYSPFRMNDFMRGILSEKHGLVELRIFDGDEPLEEALLFHAETTGKPLFPSDRPHFATCRSILEYAGHRWVLVFDSSAYFEETIDTGPVNAILLLGSIVSLLLFFVVSSLARSRNQAISLANMSLGMERVVAELKEEVIERRRAEEGLRESEERLRAVLDATPFPIAIVDSNDDNIHFWSHSALTLFGHTAPTAPAWYQIAYPDTDYRREVIDRWKPFLETARGSRKAVNTGEYRVTCKDGSICICELYVSFLNDMLIVTFNDITDRKRYEEERTRLNANLAAKNTELEQMIYVASHDLRSPLVNIDGYGRELEYAIQDLHRVLLNAPVGEISQAAAPLLEQDIPEALRFIRASTSKMDTLLTGLLRLSRLGRAALTIESLDMKRLITKVIDSTEYKIKEACVKLDVADLPPCRSDAVQVSQIFSNLLDNALKYLDPNRPGVIRITGRIVKNKSVYCVEDNGIGIASAHLDKIFEIFHRLNVTSAEGEGLGLAIVQRIVGKLEGTVRVESEVGSGSRFYVALPAGLSQLK